MLLVLTSALIVVNLATATLCRSTDDRREETSSVSSFSLVEIVVTDCSNVDLREELELTDCSSLDVRSTSLIGGRKYGRFYFV